MVDIEYWCYLLLSWLPLRCEPQRLGIGCVGPGSVGKGKAFCEFWIQHTCTCTLLELLRTTADGCREVNMHVTDYHREVNVCYRFPQETTCND